MEIPALVGTEIVGIFGPVSSGKSWLIEQWIAMLERTVYIDLGSSPKHNYPPQTEHIIGSPAAIATRLESNPYYYRLTYHVVNVPIDFYWVVNSLWVVGGARYLFIDEVHRVLGGSIHPSGEMAIRYGRHRILGIIGASQRIAEVDKLFTSQCRMVVLFYTPEERDIIKIAANWGSAIADAVSQLRPCIYNDATQTVEQEPECLVWVRGIGHKVFPLGSKIKSQQENEQLWVEHSAEVQREQVVESSEPAFLTPEPSSEENF